MKKLFIVLAMILVGCSVACAGSWMRGKKYRGSLYDDSTKETTLTAYSVSDEYMLIEYTGIDDPFMVVVVSVEDNGGAMMLKTRGLKFSVNFIMYRQKDGEFKGGIYGVYKNDEPDKIYVFRYERDPDSVSKYFDVLPNKPRR